MAPTALMLIFLLSSVYANTDYFFKASVPEGYNVVPVPVVNVVSGYAPPAQPTCPVGCVPAATYQTPTYQAPAYQAYQAPAYQAYQAPAYQVSAYQAPAYPAQVSFRPAQTVYQAPEFLSYQGVFSQFLSNRTGSAQQTSVPLPPLRPTFATSVPPTQPPPPPPAQTQEPQGGSSEKLPDGYSFSYKAPDSARNEEGSFKKGEDDSLIHVKKGSYSFTSPEGKKYKVDYIADENGYRATQTESKK